MVGCAPALACYKCSCNPSASGIKQPLGLVYVTIASNSSNSDGAIVALAAHNISQIQWSHNALEKAGTQSTVGLYFAPAIDPNLSREGVVYIGYSSRIIALSPQSGKVLGMLDRNKTTDPFVSSPTLSSDGSALFIHSAAGLIFKVLISGNYSRSTDIGNIDMSFDWCCLYSEFDQDCFFHKRNGSHELDFCSYEVWEAKAAEKGQPLPFRRYDSSAIGSPYPYATPALYPDDKTLVVTQYGEGAGAGVYAVNTDNGDKVEFP